MYNILHRWWLRGEGKGRTDPSVSVSYNVLVCPGSKENVKGKERPRLSESMEKNWIQIGYHMLGDQEPQCWRIDYPDGGYPMTQVLTYI